MIGVYIFRNEKFLFFFVPMVRHSQVRWAGGFLGYYVSIHFVTFDIDINYYTYKFVRIFVMSELHSLKLTVRQNKN